MAKLLSGTRIYGTATVDTTLFVDGTDDASSATTGAVQVVGGVGIGGTLYVEGTTVFAGDLAVNGGDLTTTATTFNLINANATTVNFAGAATTLEIGAATGTTNINNNLDVDGDVNIDGGDLTVGTSTFNLTNTTATTVNFAGAATAVNIGAATGTTSVKNNVEVQGTTLSTTQSTFNLLNTTATTVNFAGAGSSIIIGSNSGNTTVRNSFNVNIDSTLGLNTDSLNTINGKLTVNLKDNLADIFTIRESANNYIKINTSNSLELITFGVLPKYEFLNVTDASSTSVASTTFAGGVGIAKKLFVGTDLDVDGNATIGDATTDAHTVTGSLTIVAPDNTAAALQIRENAQAYFTVVTTNGSESVTFESIPRVLINNITESTDKDTGAVVIEGGVGIEKNLNVGGTLGVTGNVTLTGDLAVNGGDLTTTATTFNLLNTTATTVNFAGDGTDIQIGSATGITNINNNLDVDGDVNIDGGDLTTGPTTATFNLINTNALTGNLFGAAIAVNIGAAGSAGTTTIRTDNVVLNGDLQVQGGDITTNQTTFNVVDTTATTVNFARAGTAVTIGATTGTTTIRNANTVVTGDLAVNGGDITSSAATFNVLPTTSTTVNAFGAATALNLGDTTGTTIVRNNFEVDLNTVLNGTLQVDLNATIIGDLEIQGGDLTTNQTTFNLLNTTATTVNFAGAATTLEIGAVTGTTNINNNLDVDGDVNIDGGDLTVSTTTFNLANTTATTGNLFGAATTVNIGAAGSTGTLTVKNDNVVLDGDLQVKGGDLTTNQTTFNLINDTATTVNFAGAATTLEIGSATGTTNINNNLEVDGDVTIDGGDLIVSTTTFNLANTTATTVNFAGAATTIEIGAATGTTNINNDLDVDGDVNIDGGDLTVSTATFNLANTTASTVNFAGAGTTISIGAATGTTTINNANTVVTGDLAVNGADITTTATGTATVFNTNATGLNVGGAATAISIGAATGTTTINNANTVVTGDLAVNGADITTTATGTATVFDTNATTVNAFGAATGVNIGAAGSAGTLTIRNDNVSLTGDLAVNGGDITTNQTTFNLVNTTATTVNFAGAATAISIGAVTGTTEVNNNLQVDLDLDVRGGDITTNQTTFNLINTTATTGNLFGDGTAVTIGATTGTTTIRNANTVITGDLAVNGGDLTTSATTFNLLDSTVTTGNLFGAGTAVTIGAVTGTTTIRNANTVITGDLAVNGGDLTTNQTTFNLLNATATTVNFAGAATTLEIGAATGTTNINNNLDVDGDVNIDGGNLTVSTATFNLANTTATTGNLFGAATTVNIGSATGTTTVNNNLIVTGDLTVNGNTTIINTSTLDVEDLNITVAKGSVNAAAANGAGITVEGANATITYLSAGDEWAFNKTIDVTGAADISGNVTVGGTFTVTGDTIFTGDLAVNGGDLTTNQTTFNLINTTATTGNLFGAGTAVTIGATTGTTTIRNANTVITGDLAVNGADITTTATGTATVFNTNATTVNAFGAATSISIGTAFSSMNLGGSNATLFVGGTTGGGGAVIEIRGDASGGTVQLRTNAGVTTASIFDQFATTINAFRDGTAITIGATTGTTTIRNANTVITGDLAVNGGDITTNQTTFNLVNTTATTGNLFGAGTTVNIGAATGTTTINNANTVVTGDLAVNGGDLTTNQTTFNLLNTTATTVNAFGAATTLEIGAATGLTRVKNNFEVDGDITIDGGDLIVSTSTFNLVNTNATTVNFAGAATTLEIGAATGTTNVNNNLDVDGDVNIDGGDLTASGTTFNLINTNITTGNVFGIATTINAGTSAAAASTLNFGPAITGNTFKLAGTAVGTVNYTTDVTSGTVNAWQSVTGTVNLGKSGTINIGNSTTATTAAIVGGAITGNSLKIASTAAGSVTLNSDVTTGSVNLFNNITTGTLNVAGAGASTINLGSTTSTVNIGVLTLTTDLEVQYGGTGRSTFTTNGVIYGNSTNGLLVTAASNPGVSNATTSYGILTTDVSNVPVWTDTIDGGSY